MKTTTILISEVGPRDGLQSVKATMPTADKLRWISALHAAGLREVEVGSFVPARLLPQLADTAEIVAAARALPGLVTSVLVPNLKGSQAALDCGAHSLLLPLSATSIAALFVIQFIYGWNQYLWPLLMTTDENMYPVVMGIKRMISGGDAATEWNAVMATAMLAMIPPALVVLLMQKWFVKGLVDSEK